MLTLQRVQWKFAVSNEVGGVWERLDTIPFGKVIGYSLSSFHACSLAVIFNLYPSNALAPFSLIVSRAVMEVKEIGRISVAQTFEEAKTTIREYEVETTTKFSVYKKDKAFLSEGK